MNGPTGNWPLVALEHVVEILDSRRIPLNSGEREERIAGKPNNQLFPYYGATGQVGLIDDFLFEGEHLLLGEDGVPFLDPLKHKAYRVSGKFWVNNHAHVLRAIEGISDCRFVEAYLNAFDYSGIVTGSTRLKLTQAAMRKIPVSLPPLNEQKRIADKLDNVLARVDACRERLKVVPAILKRFRQAVLSAASSGQLTAEWAEQGGRGASEWPTVTINAVSETVFDGPFGSHLKSTDYSDSGFRVVRLENIGVLKFVGEKKTYIPDAKYDSLLRHTLEGDDILFSSFVDEEVRVCLLPENLCSIAINKADVFCIRTNRDVCLPRFLLYRLGCKSTYLALREGVHGATRPRINLKQLRAFEISLPPLEEQAEIVRRVEALFAWADRLEARLAAARSQTDRLTPSLLAKAFRGELVPQDPEDEPAAELLARLAQAGIAAKATRGRRPAKTA